MMLLSELKKEYSRSKYDKNAEIHLLGALLRGDSHDYIFENTDSNDFFAVQMAMLYSTMKSVWSKKKEWTLDSLSEESELPLDTDLLIKIANATPEHVDTHECVRILKQKAIDRKRTFSDFIHEKNENVIWDFYAQIQDKEGEHLIRETNFSYEVTAKEAELLATYDPCSLSLMNRAETKDLRDRLIQEISKQTGLDANSYQIFVDC